MNKIDPELESWPDMYREVEPIEGGLSDLRARIAADSEIGARQWGWGALVATTLCAAALGLYWSQLGTSELGASPATNLADRSNHLPHPRALSLGIVAPSKATPLRDSRVEAAARRTEGPPVLVFQWVQAQTARPEPPQYLASHRAKAHHISELAYSAQKKPEP